MTSIIDSYKDLLALYNQNKNEGNNTEAFRIAKKIVSFADEQYEKGPTAYREFYKNSSANPREFIAAINLGRNVVSASQNTVSDNSIQDKDWFADGIPKLTMKDVAGLKNVRDEFIVNIFAPLSPTYAPIYQKYRKDMGMQVLLYGPPGTGKTHLVKCLAGTLKCKIAVVKLKDALAGIVGDGAKIIDEIFKQSQKHDKCIIFFDEIDSIAASRDDEESRHTKEQLTTLLTNMDGFTSEAKPGQIRIIIAATNRPWILDSAIKRGGRFDTQIYVPLPDLEARKKLVALALGKDSSVKSRLDVPCAPNVTVEWLAEKLEGYAGADIKAVCKQIVNRPLKREIEYLSKNNKTCNDSVTRQDCEEVISKYINSLTDETLFMYDAYSANMDYLEYLKNYEPQARKAYAEGTELPPHVIRWLNATDRRK